MKKIYVKPLAETLKVECEVVISASTWNVDDGPVVGPVGSPYRHTPFWADDIKEEEM